jgi:hypothetical protein
MTTPPAPKTTDKKLLRLIEAVNEQRYRAPSGLTADYRWPQSFDELRHIAYAALRYVVSLERRS